MKVICCLPNRLLENHARKFDVTPEGGYGRITLLTCLSRHCVHLHVLRVIENIGSNVGYAMKRRKAFMFVDLKKTVKSQIRGPSQRIGKYRLRMAVASLMAALILSACGGGGDASSPGNFNIGVTVGGQLLSNTQVAPGGSLDLTIQAGQSVSLDAGEPAVWTLLVGGSAVSGGVQVYYAGANITATTLSPSAVVVDTYAAYPLPASIPITLIATSTYDSVQVATVNLLITN
jgi:hypothetical protein